MNSAIKNKRQYFKFFLVFFSGAILLGQLVNREITYAQIVEKYCPGYSEENPYVGPDYCYPYGICCDSTSCIHSAVNVCVSKNQARIYDGCYVVQDIYYADTLLPESECGGCEKDEEICIRAEHWWWCCGGCCGYTGSGEIPPPPPPCVFNCGDGACCEEDGENSSNCPQDCGGGTECWYCETGFLCSYGVPPSGTPCGCEGCVFGTIGGLVFWDKDGNKEWDGDSVDARVITSEENRCNDTGQPDVVIPGLEIIGGGNFGSAIAVDNACDPLDDDRPSCTRQRCDDPSTPDVVEGKCTNCGGKCENFGVTADAETWSNCKIYIEQSCFTDTVNSGCNGSWQCGSDTNPRSGAWVANGYRSWLLGTMFYKTVRVGTYYLQLTGLPSNWEIVNSQPYVTAKNPDCVGKPAFFALAKRNRPPEAFSLTPTSGNFCFSDSVEFTTLYWDQDEPGNNMILNGSFEDGYANWSFYGGYNNVGNSGSIDSNVIKFGSKSIRIDVVAQASGVTPYAVYSQPIPGGGGKTVTISGWARTNGSTAYICYKNETDNTVECGSQSVTGPSWQRISQTFNLPAGKKISVRLQSNNPGQAWFDGILVEEGATQGIFTDINWVQVNLENEDDLVYTDSLWPLRAMFAKERSDYSRDTFQFWVPGMSDWVEGNVSFDPSSQTWYLVSDVPVPNASDPHFTVLGGPGNTYFQLSGSTLEVHWRVQFGNSFPESPIDNPYHINLYTEDFGGLQDQTGSADDSILYLNNRWYFHRMGSLEIWDCENVSVSGKIYNVTSAYPDVNCDEDFANGIEGLSIVFDPLSGNEEHRREANTESDGSYSVELSYGETYAFYPKGEWFHSRTKSDALDISCSDSNIFVLDGVRSADLDFGISQILDPWIQVVGGDLTSYGSVQVLIPATCVRGFGDNLCIPYITTTKIDFASQQTFGSPLFPENGNGIVAANGTINYGSDPNAGYGEPNNWGVTNANFWQQTGKGFDYYRQLLDPTEHPTLEGDQSLSGIEGLDDGIVNDGEVEIRLINGNLTINQNINVAQGGLLLVVVSGNIIISDDVTNVEGLFLADDSITINDGPNDDGSDQIILEGTYVADANGDGTGAVSNMRDLGPDNNLNPAAVFIYRPDLIMTMIKENVAVESKIDWEEVKP